MKQINANLMGVRVKYIIRKNRLFINAHSLMLEQIKKLYEGQKSEADSDIISVDKFPDYVVVTLRWKPEKEAPETDEEIEQCEIEMYEKLKKGISKQGFKIE